MLKPPNINNYINYLREQMFDIDPAKRERIVNRVARKWEEEIHDVFILCKGREKSKGISVFNYISKKDVDERKGYNQKRSEIPELENEYFKKK